MALVLPLLWTRVFETVYGFMIERVSEGPNTVLRLSGQIEAEHIQQLRSEISRGTPVNAFDLDEVRLVSRDAIWFLGDCEAQGIELRQCPPYVREWIFRGNGRP
jgi:hypothetical protein